MSYSDHFETSEPTRAAIDATPGSLLLEFGTDWCPHCRRAQAPLAEALIDFPHLRHLKIMDGPGLLLGRSFGVKLWPTLILLRDGVEIARRVRPTEADDIRVALAQGEERSYKS